MDEESAISKTRLKRAPAGSCGGDKYARLFPEDMFKRAWHHMAHVQAGFAYASWHAWYLQARKVSGALNRMGNLLLSRAWEKWQV